MKKNYLIFSLIWAGFALCACTEKEPLTVVGGIAGTVTDFKTGNPLSGVAVDIVANANTTFIKQSRQTDGEGRFSFDDVEAGSYKASFSKGGYADNSRDVSVPAGQTATCDIALTIHPDFEVTDGKLTAYYGKGGQVVIPEGITSIGRSVFQGNMSLISVIIPEGVTIIEEDAFYGCENLATVTLPNSLLIIGENSFYQCYALPSINIPDGVAAIGSWAFALCMNLNAVAIPSSVDSVGYLAFSGSIKLTSITVDAGNSSYLSDNGVLFNKAKTMLVQCPAGKQGNYAIPNGVTDIEIGAFWGCSNLSSVTIPQSVTGIGEYAFDACLKLTLITVEWTNPLDVYGTVFASTPVEKIILRVPAGTRAAYQATDVWGDFGAIVEY